MASFGFYIDKPFDSEYSQKELKKIIQDCKKNRKPYPSGILNTNATSLYFIATLKIGTKTYQVKIKSSFGKVQPKDWDFIRGNRYRSNSHGYSDINDKLKKTLAEVQSYFSDISISKKSVSINTVKSDLTNIINGKIFKDSFSFLEAYDKFMEYQKQNIRIKNGTLKEYYTVYKSVIAFNTNRKEPIVFEDINQSFFEEFEDFLLKKKNPNNSKTGLRNDTIAKYISTFKTFLSWALNRDFHSNSSFLNSKNTFIKKGKNEIVTLTEEELLILYQFDLSSNSRLERVKDLFCFGCFTGQRWSDISKVDRTQIRDTYWIFYAEKTGKKTEIPLIGFAAPALSILKKYDFQIPEISNQKFNNYLKEIGELIGFATPITIQRFEGRKSILITKPKYEFMSSHMARRTTVTLLLEKGIPPTTVQKLTGHSDIRTIVKYENTSNSALETAFNSISITDKKSK